MSDDEILAVVQAHKDGKPLQMRSNYLVGTGCIAQPLGTANWRGCTHPPWDFMNYEYRVAPEPRKPREWMLFLFSNGRIENPIHYGAFIPGDAKRILVREVIEE
jgi:hypothetical protein